ncbi:MAG: hypothetical protein IIX36_07955 [Clostridia bacterium]|nr:hypothetical protein [Clostridia bacterium]
MQSALRATIGQYDAHRSAEAQTNAQRCKAPDCAVACLTHARRSATGTPKVAVNPVTRNRNVNGNNVFWFTKILSHSPQQKCTDFPYALL